MEGWIGNYSSFGGGVVLIQSSLNSILVYHMSIYLFPDTCVEAMTKIIRKFFCQGAATKKKYYMVKWFLINKPKSKGGLGIKILKLFNLSLLCKWWWRLENEDDIWQNLVKEKYKVTHGIWRVNLRHRDSAL